MIYLEDLKVKDIGKWVVFTPYHGEQERGRIKSWNDKFIFVVYLCSDDWANFGNYTACATDPKNLDFISQGKQEGR